MNKKSYGKPLIQKVLLDFHITMTGLSDYKPGPNVDDPEAFVNPLKWFK